MKAVKRSLLVAATGLALSMVGPGCMSRPVSKVSPTTKDLVSINATQTAIDKVDILFAIDNSASMGDKQTILKEAVPKLLEGLLSPACVNRESRKKTGKLARYEGSREDNYGCDQGDEPEFQPITDLHIGVVSSSLGDFGNFRNDGTAHVCRTDNKRANDRSLLLGQPAEASAPDGFLAWFPSNEENSDEKRHPKPKAPITQLTGSDTALVPAFQELVAGVGQDGCGYESQLESVYRFLIQPDPWDQVLKFDRDGKADMGKGIDEAILKQRAEFLRPDSLVAVIMLTDEDDSSADPMSVNGFGYAFMAQAFPGSTVSRGSGRGNTAPRPTSACATDPGSEDCTSCGFASACDPTTEWCQKIKQDPSCQKSGGFYEAEDDHTNVRFHRMKQRYGVDPQYPIRRYVDGFTKAIVPDRSGEHDVVDSPDGARTISDYLGKGSCTNPLFAAALPRSADEEWCKLKRGSREANKIFFAVVGGVPNQLLHFDPSGTEEADEANKLDDKDWTKILGKDRAKYDESGIDPHMIASVEPRAGLLDAGDPGSPRGQNGDDPVHGREWNTKKGDLQYACTFDLPVARECKLGDVCDCGDLNGEPDSNSPLCAKDGSPTQVKAKAYPTLRELEVVRALGEQGIAASLCPIQLNDPDAPDYGYKPAVAAIVGRLRSRLMAECLPRSLRDPSDTEGKDPVSCLVLARLDKETSQTCASVGLAVPEDAILAVYKEQLAQDGFDPDVEICKIEQTPVTRGDTCALSNDISWCYVENDGARKPARQCAQALAFSAGTAKLTNAIFSLQCIRQLAEGVAAGDNRQPR